MKKGFTLVEMLVVIGILGILLAVIVPMITNTDSARAVQCKANLKNLANAVSSRLTEQSGDHKWYPLAGSIESLGVSENDGDYEERYGEYVGWISWNSQNAYKGKVSSHRSQQSWITSAYNQNTEARDFCITNGSLWRYMGGSRTSYVCPSHIKKMNPTMRPNWSYVMNGYFRYDTSQGGDRPQITYPGRTQEGIGSKAHRILLFAELQWENCLPDVNATPSTAAGFANDCTLQYTGDQAEIIGFNHKTSNDLVAHIAFADGHVDQIVMPKRKPLALNELRKLTEFLCTGEEYSMSDGRVEKINQ